MIEVERLTKYYGFLPAITELSFTIGQGEVVGFLGPNGAGKTTTLKILTCFLPPSSGQARVNGFDVYRDSLKVREQVGYLPESVPLYTEMTVERFLSFAAQAKGIGSRQIKASIDKTLDDCGLEKVRGRIIGHLSKGFKQRVGLAQALLNNPPVLILDEPTIGLDPQSRRHLWELVRQVHQQGVTVMLTTHYMDEAQSLCQRLAIMDRGKLVAVDTPQSLIGRLQATYSVKLVLANPLSAAQLASLNGGSGAPRVQTLEGNTYVLRLDNTPGALDKVLDTIVRGNISLQHLEVTPVTLEDVFLELTGQELRD